MLEIIGFILFFIFGSLAVASGIGGGEITVPLLLIFFKFNFKKAVAISNCIVLINTFLSYLLALRRKDPLKPEKTLIDY